MKKYIAFAFISLCLVTAKSFSQVVRQLPSGISNTRETVIKSVIPPRKDELPLEQLLKSGGSGSFQVVKHNNDMPLEIGYTFQASKKGVIYSVGIILPNLMDTYTISIWDAATQTLLLRKEVGMATEQYNGSRLRIMLFLEISEVLQRRLIR